MTWLSNTLEGLNPDVDWDYALITLVVRFIGVFVVMLVMQVALQVAARVVRWIEPPEATAAESAAAGAGGGEASADEGGVVAAIALALDLEQQRSTATRRTVPTFSPWSAAGLSEAHDRLNRSR